ncbi:MAG: alpha-glucan family phosphorylase, partial [Candidatus Acidiferrales bacterium]
MADGTNPASQFPNLPERIRGLERLSYNLWWSWHRQARDMFPSIDLQAWRESDHNPLRMLAMLPQQTLDEAARDPEFLERFDAVMAEFDANIASQTGWFTVEYGAPRSTLAYFSAEYAFHHSLPLYAGGLGVLAGDYIKECSDLALPMVGVGLIYSRGYLSQKIRDDGWQEDDEKTLDRTYDPARLVRDGDGEPLKVLVPFFDPPVHVLVWRADIGRVPVYLLDTEVESNQPWDRAIAHRLYTNDPEQRLRQEIVLGIGGMRVLRRLGILPAAVHINEGHPAFAFLERARGLVEEGASFQDAIEKIRETSVFTTHTPLSAGTDVFPFPLFEKYFSSHYDKFGTDRNGLLQLGTNPSNPDAGFNMTVFALRMSKYCNAVSKKHGDVAKDMWKAIWPDKKVEDVPITAITNGVHLLTWMDPIWLQPVLEKYVGPGWIRDQDQPKIWEAVDKIPGSELWWLRLRLKALLMDEINERAREEWQKKRVRAESVIAFGALLDPEIFTIGFARRFTSYKRPDLILHDLDRLKRLLTHPLRPVQIIFAGKAHPSDIAGAQLIQKVFHLAQEPSFGARIAFVENYDQHLAARMVRGVDVWLNNPLPPLEASGTSGMKAGANGVPSVSVLDGWWLEGYNSANGWAFGGEPIEGDRTNSDAEALYGLLEDKIIPLYYHRPDDEVPHDFVRVMKAAIKSVAPQFSSRRMLKEYVKQFYVKALGIEKS